MNIPSISLDKGEVFTKADLPKVKGKLKKRELCGGTKVKSKVCFERVHFTVQVYKELKFPAQCKETKGQSAIAESDKAATGHSLCTIPAALFSLQSCMQIPLQLINQENRLVAVPAVSLGKSRLGRAATNGSLGSLHSSKVKVSETVASRESHEEE